MVKIALTMMIKNEEQFIDKTFDSVSSFIDIFIILDTGSTDNTIEHVTKYCNDNGKKLYLLESPFQDFSTSRNKLLTYCESIIDVEYLLLMDSGDYMKNTILSNLKEDAYIVKQRWTTNNSTVEFKNIRIIKNRSGWRYKGPVHEYLLHPDDITPPDLDIVIYQNRTDNEKTFNRFEKDKELLWKEYKNNKTPRTIFYLAQTLQCLNEYDKALELYKERCQIKEFDEEIFESYKRCGDILKLMNKSCESNIYYMKSLDIMNRVEPLLRLSEYYAKKCNWILSYCFVKSACMLPYPDNCELFVDVDDYNYKRWHILGMVAYYVGKYDEGIEACKIAIDEGSHKELDMYNLSFYEK